jgi:CNP1-like family protein
MRARARAALACGALLVAIPCPALSQWSGWDYDYDREKKPWSEMQAQIPPYPKDANLIAFEAGGASPHKFYIDGNSISIGEDGVVRYTLVIRAAGGATNVSFEGIRCSMREHKIYAIGQNDGTWSRPRNPQWRRIEYQQVNRQYGVLYSDFFCASKKPVKNVGEAVRLLKYPQSPPLSD